jgi:hypothetical protein
MSISEDKILNTPPTPGGVCCVEVAPRDQVRVLLGTYDGTKIPDGFAVTITPDPDPDDSVTTYVTSIKVGQQIKQFLHIANFGDTPVEVETRQIKP